MRKKELRIIVTFHTTTSAIGFESHAHKKEIQGRLIPVPKEITAGCGLSFSAPVSAEDEVRELASEMEHDAVYKMVI